MNTYKHNPPPPPLKKKSHTGVSRMLRSTFSVRRKKKEVFHQFIQPVFGVIPCYNRAIIYFSPPFFSSLIGEGDRSILETAVCDFIFLGSHVYTYAQLRICALKCCLMILVYVLIFAQNVWFMLMYTIVNSSSLKMPHLYYFPCM